MAAASFRTMSLQRAAPTVDAFHATIAAASAAAVRQKKLWPAKHLIRTAFECAYMSFWAVQVTPRGVQLQLVGGAGEVVGDTLVMSNLGYFQLKAYPGVFQLQLAPGRTRQLYTIQSSTGVTEDAQAQVLPISLEVPCSRASWNTPALKYACTAPTRI